MECTHILYNSIYRTKNKISAIHVPVCVCLCIYVFVYIMIIVKKCCIMSDILLYIYVLASCYLYYLYFMWMNTIGLLTTYII